MAQSTPHAPSDPRHETPPRRDRAEAKPKAPEDAAQARADAIAASQVDPATAAQQEALQPSPVYYLPDQAEGNPGVQGFVFRPHQEKGGVEMEPLARPSFGDQVRQEKEARDRRWQGARDAARARGDTLPDERPGAGRLRLLVDVSAHSVVDEGQLGAIAAAADGLVAALWDAGIRPQKAGVSGIPF